MATKRDSFQYHCFDIQGGVAFQMGAVCFDSPGRSVELNFYDG